MKCNIDAKGKALRLASGFVVSLCGVILLVLAAAGLRPSIGVWVSAMLLITFGAFQIFVGWKGWCIVRAMGFKTRI